MATAISFANGKNGFCQVNSNCRSIHLDFPFLHFRLTVRNSILAHRCRLAYATSGMWEVPFIVIRGKGKLPGLRRVWSERPRVAGRYSGCYVRTTVSGDSSDHTLASDAHLHTCFAGTRGVIILLHSHQDGANVRASRPSFLSCCRVPHWLEESSWGTGPFLASCRTSTASGHRPQAGIVIPRVC